MTLPPGPRGGLPGATVLAFRRDPTGFLAALARDHGDLVHFRLGPQHVVLVNDPDLIERVLVTEQRRFTKGSGQEHARLILGDGLITSEGEAHLRRRRIVQPAFHRERIAAYGSVMTAGALRAAGRWREGEEVDIAAEMARLTLDIVARTLFDADVEAEAEGIVDALGTIMGLFDWVFVPYPGVVVRLPIPPARRFRRAQRRLDATVWRLIRGRRDAGDDRGDLLSMLLQARDEEGGPALTDEQVRDEAMTILVAGHETVTNALAWTWYLLAVHPDAERRLHDEVDRLPGDRLPRAADVSALAYAERVFSEALRLYPPSWVIGRTATDHGELGDRRLPAGTIVLLSQYVTHRDRRFFPDPERFDPDRWAPGKTSARPKLAFFPFGAGPRRCIGEPFAWLEAVLVLATIAREWRLRLVPGQPIAPQPLVTLRPRHGIRMITERRRA